MDKKQCAERVWDNFHDYACSRSAKNQEDGKWWCTIHTPSRVKAKREAKSAMWKAERDAREAADARVKSAANVLGVTARLDYPSTSAVVVPLDWFERIATEKGWTP